MHEVTGEAASTARSSQDRLYAGYVLIILVLANTLNSIDRAIVNLLVEPIRLEFGLTDTQMGLVGGLGFSLFYALLGIPIARIADRRSRTRILAAGIAVWTGFTVLTGRAIGFWSLLLARFGVGAGESTCYPCALSLISDYFRPAQRPRAIGIYQLGLNLGFIFGAAIAGLVAQRHGWRAAFAIMGIPGVVLALVVLLTIREPVRGAREAGARVPQSADDGNWASALRALLANRPFLLLLCASACMSTGAATLANWGSAYIVRSFGLSIAEVGVKVGPVVSIGGAIGTILGGVFGTIVARRTGNPYKAVLVVLFSALPGAPFMALFALAPTMTLVLVGGVGGGVFTAMHYGPLVAVALNLVPASRRALAGSMLVLAQTVIGFGLGPLIAGIISDALRPALGAESLRYSLLLAPVAVLTAWLFTYRAWRILRRMPVADAASAG